jgi:hypothetical protein
MQELHLLNRECQNLLVEHNLKIAEIKSILNDDEMISYLDKVSAIICKQKRCSTKDEVLNIMNCVFEKYPMIAQKYRTLFLSKSNRKRLEKYVHSVLFTPPPSVDVNSVESNDELKQRIVRAKDEVKLLRSRKRRKRKIQKTLQPDKKNKGIEGSIWSKYEILVPRPTALALLEFVTNELKSYCENYNNWKSKKISFKTILNKFYQVSKYFDTRDTPLHIPGESSLKFLREILGPLSQ